jgi:hypothetical protein
VDELAEAADCAEAQTAALQARAEALSEQIRAGGPKTLPPMDAYRIQEQLDALTREAAVEEELTKIRQQAASLSSEPPPGRPAGDDR